MKRILRGLVLASVLLGSAQASSGGGSYKSGFYAGALFGYSRMHVDFKNTYSRITVLPAEVGFVQNKTIGYQGNVMGGVVFGYRYLVKSFLLGADCDISLYNTTVSKLMPLSINNDGANAPFTARLQRYYSITPSFVFGVPFSKKWQVFLKFGMGISKFTSSIKNETVVQSFSTTKTVLGFVPAIGGEYALTDSLSVLGIVSYEWYQKVRFDVGDELVAAPGLGAKISDRFVSRPQIFNVRVGVLLKI